MLYHTLQSASSRIDLKASAEAVKHVTSGRGGATGELWHKHLAVLSVYRTFTTKG